MVSAANANTLEQLLSGLSSLEVREHCLDALRACQAERARRSSDRERFGLSEMGRYLLPILATRKGVAAPSLDTGILNGFRDATRTPHLRNVVEFAVWFIRAGFGFSISFPADIYLTAAGLRLLEHAADHPLLPGAIDRVCARCLGLPPEVASLLTDSRLCLDHGLLRPAIVMIGVAYELAIESIVDSHITSQKLPKQVGEWNAAKRLGEVRTQLNSLLPATTSKDDRLATTDALDFANALRRRRNDASHTAPTYGFEDREEIEELFVSALRHLPNLWNLR